MLRESKGSILARFQLDGRKVENEAKRIRKLQKSKQTMQGINIIACLPELDGPATESMEPLM